MVGRFALANLIDQLLQSDPIRGMKRQICENPDAALKRVVL
jgi:hypothetical protein